MFVSAMEQRSSLPSRLVLELNNYVRTLSLLHVWRKLMVMRLQELFNLL
jgi:hypothetical protein